MLPINMDALMHYDLDVSAKETGKVLAVVPGSGNRRNLTIVDLKSTSLWNKIKLWWHNSLSKRTISNFLAENMKEFSEKARENQKTQVDFEMQCAKLFRKIRFIHAPAWNLTITFEFPDGAKKNEEYEIATFDRLTRKEDLVNIIVRKRVRYNINGVLFDLKLSEVFKTYSISGDFSSPPVGAYLSNTDEGKDREMTVSFSNLDEQYIEQIAKESMRFTRTASVTPPTTQAQPCSRSPWGWMRPGKMSKDFLNIDWSQVNE